MVLQLGQENSRLSEFGIIVHHTGLSSDLTDVFAGAKQVALAKHNTVGARPTRSCTAAPKGVKTVMFPRSQAEIRRGAGDL